MWKQQRIQPFDFTTTEFSETVVEDWLRRKPFNGEQLLFEGPTLVIFIDNLPTPPHIYVLTKEV